MNGACNGNFFCPAPWGPGEGSNGHISFNFNYKINFKDVYTKFCVCSHKRKKQNISDRIFILLPGSCHRGVTWGCLGFKNQILSHRLSVISPPESLDQIQPNEVCEFLTCMGRATAKINSWGGVKRSNNFNNKVNFKDFYTIFCVCSHKLKIQNISDRIFFCHLGHSLGVVLWGA